MSANAAVATGWTLVGGTSGWSAEKLSFSFDGISREAHETSHAGTAAPGAGTIGNRTFIPGQLSDPGSIGISGHFNPDTLPPMDEVAETWTFTFRATGGDSTGAIWAASGFMTGFTPQGDLDAVKTFDAEIKLSGNITRTAGA